MDNLSPEMRHYNMARIRSTNTKPEETVRKYLFANGFRFRKNVKELPGCPDIVLPKYKTVVFVNGCFWHMHETCGNFVWPRSNPEYWHKKICKNVVRDKTVHQQLKKLGWNVMIIWECELKKTQSDIRLNQLTVELRDLCVALR